MSEDSQVENCNGFRFCKNCGRLCIPMYASSEPNTMIFKCDTCKERRCFINPLVRDDGVIKKTQVLQAEAADIKHRSLGEDPSMPRKTLFCKQCVGDCEAVYYYKAGNEEKNIVTQYICTLCGYSWTSDDLLKWDNEGTLRDPVDPRNNNDDEEDDEDADADLEAAARRNDDDDDGDDGDIFDEDDEIDNARKKLDEESFDIFGEDERMI